MADKQSFASTDESLEAHEARYDAMLTPEMRARLASVPPEPPALDSGTYGELPDAIRALIQGHEWDNMTRDEQRAWLIRTLAVQAPPARDGETRDEQPSRWVQHRPEVPGPPEMVCRYCGKRPGQATHKGTPSAYCTCGDPPARDGETLSDEEIAQFREALTRGAIVVRHEHILKLCDTVAALRADLADARADKEQWAAQATANAKDVLRMNWLEAAGGLYDLCCWNVDWPSVNNGWTVGSDEIDDIAKAQTAREALDEAIAARPEVLATRAASGQDRSDQQTGRARSEESDGNG